MNCDDILTRAVEILETTPELFGNDKDQIAQKLKDLRPDAPRARQRLADEITDLADQKYPELLDALFGGNIAIEELHPTRGGNTRYSDLAGNPPGTASASQWLCCPKDGCAYRIPQRAKGQRIPCDQCGTLMKPEK